MVEQLVWPAIVVWMVFVVSSRLESVWMIFVGSSRFEGVPSQDSSPFAKLSKKRGLRRPGIGLEVRTPLNFQRRWAGGREDLGVQPHLMPRFMASAVAMLPSASK